MVEFTLASYASIFFFVVGLRLALFHKIDFNVPILILIFAAVATPLSFVLTRKSIEHRLFISIVWTSVILIGFRFGKKFVKGRGF